MNSLPDDRPATGITYYDVDAMALAFTTLFVKTHATLYTTMYPLLRRQHPEHQDWGLSE